MSTDEGGIPDHSLIKDGKPALFIEAKKMSIDIDQKAVISQLGKYSYSEGTKYGVLTNGTVWMLIRSFEEGTRLHERIVWKTDIENEEPSKVIRKITTISKINIERIEDLVKKNQILDEIWQSLLNKPKEIVMGLSLVVEPIIKQNYSDYQFEDSEIEDLLKEKVKELISGQFGKEKTPDEPVELISKSAQKQLSDPIIIVASDWKHRKDLGKGIFEWNKDQNKRIDVSLSGNEVKRKLKELGLCLKSKSAFGGFYYNLRTEAELVKHRSE